MAERECCPGGAMVDVDALARGEVASVICLKCGRWWCGPKSTVNRKALGIMGPRPGDVFIDAVPAATEKGERDD